MGPVGTLEIEARINNLAHRYLHDGLRETDSVYSPFAPVAAELGYQQDPTLEPSPFFTTLHGYRRRFDPNSQSGPSTTRLGEETSA